MLTHTATLLAEIMPCDFWRRRCLSADQSYNLMKEQVLGSSRMVLNGGMCQWPLKAEFLAGQRSQTEAGGTRGTAPSHRKPDSSRALAAGSPGANKQVALTIQDDMVAGKSRTRGINVKQVSGTVEPDSWRVLKGLDSGRAGLQAQENRRAKLGTSVLRW